MKKGILLSLLVMLCIGSAKAQITISPYLGGISITPDDNEGTSISNYSNNITQVLGISLSYKSVFIEYCNYYNRYEYVGSKTIRNDRDIYSVLTSGTTHHFKLGKKHKLQNLDFRYSAGYGFWNNEHVYVFNLNDDSNFEDWDIDCQQLSMDIGVDIQVYDNFKYYFDIGGQLLLSNNTLQSNTLALVVGTGIRYDIKIKGKQSITNFLNRIW